jgi:hypothetical protein
MKLETMVNETEVQTFWGLDASKIETIDDVKAILGAMDLFVREDLPLFDNVRHLFTEERKVEMTKES